MLPIINSNNLTVLNQSLLAHGGAFDPMRETDHIGVMITTGLILFFIGVVGLSVWEQYSDFQNSKPADVPSPAMGDLEIDYLHNITPSISDYSEIFHSRFQPTPNPALWWRGESPPDYSVIENVPTDNLLQEIPSLQLTIHDINNLAADYIYDNSGISPLHLKTQSLLDINTPLYQSPISPIPMDLSEFHDLFVQPTEFAIEWFQLAQISMDIFT